MFIPYWWNRFVDKAQNRTLEATERPHGDRIQITPESPEAMEEPLWMAFFPSAHDPAVSHSLGDRHDNPEFERFYRDHIRKLLLVRGGTRYASKGNYNVTRLEYLLRIFPDARFVIPIREREKFKDAIRTKLVLDIARYDGAPRVVPVAAEAPRISCTIGEVMWQRRWGSGGIDWR